MPDPISSLLSNIQPAMPSHPQAAGSEALQATHKQIPIHPMSCAVFTDGMFRTWVDVARDCANLALTCKAASRLIPVLKLL